MTDPDVRVVVQGLKEAERRIALLLRERRRLERLAAEAQRKLAAVDRDLERLGRQLRRVRQGQ